MKFSLSLTTLIVYRKFNLLIPSSEFSNKNYFLFNGSKDYLIKFYGNYSLVINILYLNPEFFHSFKI